MDAYDRDERPMAAGLEEVRRVDRWARDFTTRSIAGVQ
jgi:hypothetical protein